jgi:hypothetical protein
VVALGGEGAGVMVGICGRERHGGLRGHRQRGRKEGLRQRALRERAEEAQLGNLQGDA